MDLEIVKTLKEIAKRLPLMKVEAVEKHQLKGYEILEWETITEIDGKPIDPMKTYLYNFPVVSLANHERRLIRAFKRNNMDGVMSYLKFIDDLVGKQKAEKANANGN